MTIVKSGIVGIGIVNIGVVNKYIIYDLTSWLLTLDGTNYAELSEPITLTGAFKIEVGINTTNQAQHNILSGGETGVDAGYLIIAADGTLTVRMPEYQGGILADVRDGEEHKVEITRDSNNLVRVLIDDAQANSTYSSPGDVTFWVLASQSDLLGGYFLGRLPSLAITDLTTPANSVSWKLDSGPPKYEVGGEYSLNDPSLGVWVDNTDGSFSITGDGSYQPLGIVSPNSINSVMVFSFTIRAILGGALKVSNNGVDLNTDLGIGTHHLLFLQSSDATFNIARSSGTITATVSNISVKPYIDTISDGTLFEPSEKHGIEADIMRADDWNVPPSGVVVNGKIATFDGTQTGTATVVANSGDLHNGLYILTYKVYGETVGNVKCDMNATPDQGYKTSGVYTAYQNPVDKTLRVLGNIDFDGSVEIISVKPVPKGLTYQNVTEEDWSQS